MDAHTSSVVGIDGDVQGLELQIHSMPRHRAALWSRVCNLLMNVSFMLMVSRQCFDLSCAWGKVLLLAVSDFHTLRGFFSFSFHLSSLVCGVVR